MTPYLLILAVLLGIAPGLIAHGKGRNFLIWWIYGVFLGPVALLHAILLRQHPNPYYAAPSFAASPYAAPDRPQRTRWRSAWPFALWGAASVAIAIIAVTGYGLLSSTQFGFQNQEREVSVSADRTSPSREQAAPAQVDTSLQTAVGQSAIADLPAAERPVQRNTTPTVRVSVRHESLAVPPPEKTERAPSIPVERILPTEAETASTASPSLERTTPIEGKTQNQVATRTDPVRAAEPPPTAPPAATPNTPIPPIAARTPEPPKAPAAAPAPPPVTAVGETVQIVQLALVKKGYNPGPTNGRAGLKTQAAVRKFQSDSGMQPTGAIDYDLLEKLGIVGPRVHAFRPPPGASPSR